MRFREEICFHEVQSNRCGMLAASLLAYPVSSLAETKKFSDVPDDSFAKDAIYYLVGGM